MGFETQSEKPKSKQELIREKMEAAEKIQTRIDQLLDQITEEPSREELKTLIADINQIHDDVIKLMSDEDEVDAPNKI